MGVTILKEEVMDVPTLAPQAAIILAREGDWEAIRYLRDRLAERYNTVQQVFLYRAKAAAALIAGGHPASVAELQALLRTEDPLVHVSVCIHIGEIGKRNLLTILHPAIESTDPNVSLAACEAAIAIAEPDFRERLIEIRE